MNVVNPKPDPLEALGNARFVFWVCPNEEGRQNVRWTTEDGKMTPQCLICGKKGEPR